jgi:Uma2 family endonuclease
MSMAVSALLTDEEFLSLPDGPGKRELLDGKLIELPPAKYFHSEMAKRLSCLLETVVDQSRVWIETAYRLTSGRWLTPDVSVSWPNQRIEGWFQDAPMLAVEIASRGNTPEEIDAKVATYLDHGAAEVWIVYPNTRSMMVFSGDSALRVPGNADYRCDALGVTVTPEYRTAAEPAR